LPEASARLQALRGSLRGEYARWGYQAIITPLYEYVEVLERGLGQGRRKETFKFVEPRTGDVVALRPDITPQVARLYATRYAESTGPARFCYDGRVVRSGPVEIFQSGVELLGCGGPEADAEVIALLASALRGAGLAELQIDVGQGEVARAVLEGLPLPSPLRAAAAALIAKKDLSSLRELCAEAGLEGAEAKTLVGLASWYGAPAVLDEARTTLLASAALAPPALASALDALVELESVVKLLEEDGLGGRISVDLGELRDLDYHDGILFHAYVAGQGAALAGGGRYDHLCERYGKRARATGFAIDLERVLLALDRGPARVPRAAPRFLVAGERKTAGEIARALRGAGSVAVRAQHAADADAAAGADADARTTAGAGDAQAASSFDALITLRGARATLALRGGASRDVAASDLFEAARAGDAALRKFAGVLPPASENS